MIDICVKNVDDKWYGFAFTGQKILAATVSATREESIRTLVRSIPFSADHHILSEDSEFTERTIHMLSRLDSGDEEDKNYSLATEYMPEPNAGVLTAVAAVPIGYVTSYGNIAKIADTDAQTVGKIMAANPLYPIVPCHRVVGVDFSLVGYGGGKHPSALRAKLARLRKETKGFKAEKEILVNGKKLMVYPVERVINKAEKQDSGSSRQRSLAEY